VRRSVGGGVGGDAQAGTNFRKFLVEGTKPNLKKIKEYVERSLMLVTALSPVIGYDKHRTSPIKLSCCAPMQWLTLYSERSSPQTRRWREPDSNRRSLRGGNPQCQKKVIPNSPGRPSLQAVSKTRGN
jgi:hypothetical protein